MASLKVLVPGMNKARNRKNDTPTFVFIQLPTGPKTSQDEQDDLLKKMREQDQCDIESDGQQQQTPTSRTKKKAPISETNPLTAEEEQLRREEEKLREIEVKVQREINEKRQELLAREGPLRELEARMEMSSTKFGCSTTRALSMRSQQRWYQTWLRTK